MTTQSAYAPSLQCPGAVLHPGMQGIQRVAVDDSNARLLVTFYLPVEAYLLDPASYSLTGGQRLFPRVIKAQAPAVTSPPQPPPQQVLLSLDGLGDFSIYTLTVAGPDVDPFYSSHPLRFRMACDEHFDCRITPAPSAAPAELPVVIDYLSKDYSSFRQALLDFISVRMPAWTERSEADLGIMLLELLSYTADNLSYLQDRVANEAFLATASQRRSVAGHLELIGYQMDEGASAHTWLQFQVADVHTLEPSEAKVTNQPRSAAEPVIVFEPLVATRLDPAHNSMQLYTWGNSDCCLPADALTAALVGSFPELAVGDYLLISDAQDADVVRLTAAPQTMPAPFPSATPESPPVGRSRCSAGPRPRR